MANRFRAFPRFTRLTFQCNKQHQSDCKACKFQWYKNEIAMDAYNSIIILLIVSIIIFDISLSIVEKSINVVGSSKTITRIFLSRNFLNSSNVSCLVLPSLSISVMINMSPSLNTSSVNTMYLALLKFFPVCWSV